MTREEQIRQEASEFALSMFSIRPELNRDSFIAGAKWADEHPNPDTVKRLFEFALNNTNFLIADNLDLIDWDKLVKQAMEE